MRAVYEKRLRFVILLMASIFVSPGLMKVAAQTTGAAAEPVRLTAEADHQRLMALLHIGELRRGPSGDPKAAGAANVDESKVPPYVLPDPLILKSGKRVNDAEAWWKLRRPEIVEDFDREIFGREPKDVPKVKWELVETK